MNSIAYNFIIQCNHFARDSSIDNGYTLNRTVGKKQHTGTTMKVNSETIILHAIDLFRLRGYHNTSMSDIADACGLIKGSLYHHFKNKEELAIHAIEKVHQFFHDEIFSIAYDTSLSSAERFKSMILKTETFFLSRDGGCLMGNLALEIIDTVPGFREGLQRYFFEWNDSFTNIYLDKLQEKTARIKAEKAVSEIQGAIMMMRVFNDSGIFTQINKNLLNEFKYL